MFRDVNEMVEGAARRTGVGGEVIFVCECGDELCAEAVVLTLDEYAAIRAAPARFFVRPGHFDPEIETIVEQTAEHWVVEKTGAAAEAAEDAAADG